MSLLVAPMAVRRDVCRVITSTVALWHKVFCSALQRARRA
jgi:hypothetical protein